jgi:photosystem II stability/assembly factor-like uncharacterized protein
MIEPDQAVERGALEGTPRARWFENVLLLRLAGGPEAWTSTARRLVAYVLGLGALAVAGLIAYTLFEVVTWPGRYTGGAGFGGLVNANLNFDFGRAILFLGPLAVGGTLLGSGVFFLATNSRRAATSVSVVGLFVVQLGSQVVTLAGLGIVAAVALIPGGSWAWLVRTWLVLLGLIVAAAGVTLIRQPRWKSNGIACAALAAVVLLPLTAALADHASAKAQAYLVANGGFWAQPFSSGGAGGTWAGSGFWTAAPRALRDAVESYQAVSCPTAGYCIALGFPPFEGSVWSVSTDGGVSWRTASAHMANSWSDSSTFDAYNNFSCWDSSHCLAVGLSPAVQTSDGGLHWSEVRGLPPDPQSDLETAAYCPSTLRCFILGMRSAKRAAVAVVLVTKDGGENWASAEVPAGIAQVTSVSCNGTQCIGVGSTETSKTGAILSSANGGMSWRKLPAPEPFLPSPSYIACTGRDTCVLFALWVPAPSKTGPNQARIDGFVTSDGGRTWTRSRFPKLPDGQHPQYDGLPMVACSSTRCVSYGPPVFEGSPSRSPLLTSTDKGRHWAVDRSVLSLVQLARNSVILALTCDQGGLCVAVGKDTKGGVIYFSHDSGSTWGVAHGIRGGPPWAATRNP